MFIHEWLVGWKALVFAVALEAGAVFSLFGLVRGYAREELNMFHFVMGELTLTEVLIV